MKAIQGSVNLSKLSEKDQDQLRNSRWACRTNLEFLSRHVLGHKHVEKKVHGSLINSLQKFTVPNDHQYYDNDRVVDGQWNYTPLIPIQRLEGKRRTLILDARGHLKTTINMVAHSIQWLLNYPDISILLVQANLDKAQMFLDEIKRHFQYNQKLRRLFPEYCPQRKVEDWGTMSEFTVEARNKSLTRRESSVMTASIDSATAGLHFEVMKFSDVVEPQNTGTITQIMAVRKNFIMMQNLLISPVYWIDVEGTRYNFCFDGDTNITMGDWSQKPIKDIKVGDEIVGWELTNKRYLKKTTVIAKGSFIEKTNKYTFESGRSIICTPDHKFWRGKQWKKNSKNKEYSEIKRLKSVRRLMIPCVKNETCESGWLAGIYDGEGTFGKNPNHPSGVISICQSMHNPTVIERIRTSLTALDFNYREQWHDPAIKGNKKWKKRCNFYIVDGWQARYRFLTEIQPVRKEKILASLFGQLQTDEDKIVAVEDAGEREVHWLECGTGNYIADGLCSKNSDLYGSILEQEEKKAPEKRNYKIYVRGCFKKKTPDGKPQKFLPEELDYDDLLDENGKRIPWWPIDTEGNPRFPLDKLEDEESQDPYIFSCQKLNKPQGGIDGQEIFSPDKFFPQISQKDFKSNVRVAYYELSIDTAETDNERSNYSAIVVGAWSSNGRCYIVEIVHGKFLPDELVKRIFITAKKYAHRLNCIKIERTPFVRGLMVSIRSIMDRNPELNYPIVEIPRDTHVSKTERILNTLQAPYKEGNIRFVVPDEPTEEEKRILKHLKEELRRFPKYEYNDILDACADLFQEKEWFGREIARPTFEQATQDAYLKLLGVESALDEMSDGTLNPSWYNKTGGL